MASQENVLRLLIAEESLNDAEMLISVLRNAGHAVRPSRVEDEEDLLEALDGKAYDLFLCSTGLEELPLDRVHKALQQSGKDIPLVAVSATEDPEKRQQALTAGAADLVSKEDLKHLQLVIRREMGHLNDRRRLRRLEVALREVEKRCHVLLDSSRDAIAYVHEGMHIYANRAYLEKFGYEGMDDIEGMPLLDMAAPEDQSRLKDFLRNYQKDSNTESELEVTMRAYDTSPVHVIMTFSPATIEGEPCTQILMRDTSSNKELEAQLNTLSKQDLLTGLYNRQYFMEQLDQVIGSASSDESAGASLLYLQLDNLDAVRQSLGIAGVDALISDVGSLITAELKQEGVAARFGDEVFTVLLPQESVHEAMAVAEALRLAVEEHVAESGGRTITSTCSVGATMIGETTASAQAAINDASHACDQARSGGGNRIHLHTVEEDKNADEGSLWRQRIEDALQANKLFLVYQPIASLQGDPSERYEVRLRMQSEHGIIMPDEFVPQAEQQGLMPAVDRWVVGAALKVLAERRAKGAETVQFIKISGPTLADGGFLDFLDEQLKIHKVKGEWLVFQVNEPVAVTQLNQAKELFRGLKTRNCGFSLDHFGSGLNPFQLVKHLPADYLKVDGTLTKNVGSNKENAENVKQLISNAHAMQKKVIAGYLEDASSLAMLWQQGTDFVQGYFLAEPEPGMNYDFSGMVI
jgi:diguanylate cyclase (GGDEF)-like protein/PAS domain S-box-containing protein